MKAVELKKGIYWVGAIDWKLKDFHGYLTRRGSTYNSYLIIDEKVTLVDTVKHYCFDEMLARIKSVTDPAKIDYIVTNHVEMDHSGGLPELLKICPNAVIITSPNGEKGLIAHYNAGWKMRTVNTGDKINIGKRNLSFVLMPMVHWPDSMATYIPEEKLLLPNDAFGQHLATDERFDDEVEWNMVREEAAKYYANIVLPYGAQVKKALGALAGLDIKMIGPSHGLIWRSKISEIVGLYDKWSGNFTEEKAVIVYDTMWGSTEKIAEAIHKSFESKNIRVRLMNLKNDHISDVMTEILTAKYICVGSPTLNNGVLPTIAAFLAYMKGLAPKGRRALAFGSYGWGGQSVAEIDKVLRESGFDVMDGIKAQWVPSSDALRDIGEKFTKVI